MKHKKAMITAGICAAALAISAVFCKPVRWMLNPMPRLNGTLHICIDGQPYRELTLEDSSIDRVKFTCFHSQFYRGVTYITNDSTLPWLEVKVKAPNWWSAARYDLTYDFDSHDRNVDITGTAEIVNEHGKWQTIPIDNVQICGSEEAMEYTCLLHPELALQNYLGVFG